MWLSIAQCSNPGGRDENEDYVGFCANETMGCFAIADGTGGCLGGEVAARAVVTEVMTRFVEAPAQRSMSADWTFEAARSALAQARVRHPEWSDMNTTVATLVLDTTAARASWSHLGDTRIYLFRNGRAHVLTRDHSVLQAMLDAGYARGPVRRSPERSALYASVGCPGTPPAAVSKEPLALLSGDVFLLCSDGFWDAVDEAAMEDTLRGAERPEQWVQRMVDSIDDPAAQERDNFSALAIWVGARIEVTRVLDHLPRPRPHSTEPCSP